ncbi:unknown [Bacteroides sp. CAG:1060]|nr:unknown [Bacteroides sp. CAG:1060]
MLLSCSHIELEVGCSIAAAHTASSLRTRILGHKFVGFLEESLGLLECTGCKVIIVSPESVARCSKHCGSTQVKLRVAAGKCPHIIRGSAALAVCRYLVWLQRRIVVISVSKGSSVAEMVVVVEYRVGQTL